MFDTYYILDEGTLVQKDFTILFTNKNLESTYIPIKQLSDLYLNVHIQISPKLIDYIMSEGIQIHYFNDYAYYIGTLVPFNHTRSGKSLTQEVDHYKDVNKRFLIAKLILIAAFKNMNHVIQYHLRKNAGIHDEKLSIPIDTIMGTNTIQQLMSVEGQFRKKYYNNVAFILGKDQFTRTYPDARDLVNILFNFLNSLLYSVILSEIKKTHISGEIGFIHEVDHNRYPLVYDISEIFKPIMVDRLIIRLIHKKQLTDDMVVDGKLTPSAVQLIFKEWNHQINTKIHHRRLKRTVTYRYLIRDEIYKLEKHINGTKTYDPFVTWW